MERKDIYKSLSAEVPQMVIHTDWFLDFYNGVDENYVTVSISSEWEINIEIFKTKAEYEDWDSMGGGWVISMEDYEKFEAMPSEKFDKEQQAEFAKMIQWKIDLAYDLCFTY